jgi:transcriptional regulator GlxA family with amidase domain
VQIDIILFAGFDELDAIGPFEVFLNAAKLGANFTVRLVAPTGGCEVVAAHGLRIRAAAGMCDEPRPDLIVVPGGGWADRSPEGAWAEAARGEIPRYLAERHAAGAIVASVCTGGMLLATAGVLKGRSATTHHVAIEDLKAAGIALVDERVVDHGDVITSGGVTSGIDLALWLTERFAGAEIAGQVARNMEHERVGRVWRGEGPSADRSAQKTEACGNASVVTRASPRTL